MKKLKAKIIDGEAGSQKQKFYHTAFQQDWARMKKWIKSQIIHYFFRFESQITNHWKILILNQSPWKWFESISNQIQIALENDLWFEKDLKRIQIKSISNQTENIIHPSKINSISVWFEKYSTHLQLTT